MCVNFFRMDFGTVPKMWIFFGHFILTYLLNLLEMLKLVHLLVQMHLFQLHLSVQLHLFQLHFFVQLRLLQLHLLVLVYLSVPIVLRLHLLIRMDMPQ